MDRIVILGGGVGGTLTANLLARKLHARLVRNEVDITLIDSMGAHVYQPGFMYHASFPSIPMLRWSLSGETLDRGTRRSTPVAFSVRGLTNGVFCLFWFV